MPPLPDPAVVRVLREYRQMMDAKEASLMADMATRWLEIENVLNADIALLAREMADRAETGKVITEQMIWRQERYQIIKAQLEDEIKRYNQAYAVAKIERAQEDYALLGINAAQGAITASIGPFGRYWTRINLGAVQAMIGYAGDGSPLYSLLKNDYPDAVDGLLQALINGLARGMGPGQIAQDMANGMGMGLERALLIARTEAARAYRSGSTEQYRQSEVVTGFRRLVKKETACMSCLLLDGETFDMESELDDHPRGKAELPGNLIIADDATSFVTLRHDGEIVTIRTATGKFLAVTSNHPVLTDRGWIAAKFIKVGNNVISHGGDNWTTDMTGPDKKHIPALVEKIPSTFNMLRLGSVPETAKHLYSKWEDGKVDVVFTNRFLWDSFNSAQKQQIKQELFGRRDIRSIPFYAASAIAEIFESLLSAARPLLSVGNCVLSFGGRHASPAQVSGLGHGTAFGSIFGQDPSNHISGNVKQFSNHLLRFPGYITRDNLVARQSDFVFRVDGQFTGLNRRSFGFTPKEVVSLEIIRKALASSVPTAGSNLARVASNVVLDSVCEVGIRTFSGHVYSLQTQEEWYSSNHIISHNCTAVPNVEGIKAPAWEFGAQWFRSLDPEEQAARMGAEKYALWQEGRFSLMDLAQKTQNDTWGDSPRVPSIAELTN